MWFSCIDIHSAVKTLFSYKPVIEYRFSRDIFIEAIEDKAEPNKWRKNKESIFRLRNSLKQTSFSTSQFLNQFLNSKNLLNSQPMLSTADCIEKQIVSVFSMQVDDPSIAVDIPGGPEMFYLLKIFFYLEKPLSASLMALVAAVA